MLLHILGSGAGGGFPQWNCNCRLCAGQRAGRLRAMPRTQSSLAVSADGKRWVLINASPDIRQQLATLPAITPDAAVRTTTIAGVVLMDAQIDHVAGLLSLREAGTLELHCTAMVQGDLINGLPLLTVLGHYGRFPVHEIPLAGASFTVAGAGGLRFTAIPLSSKAPPYSPHRHDPHPGDNIGLRIENAAGRRAFYAPGLGAIDDAVAAELAAADCALIDGTFWSDDEMTVHGISTKRAHDMGHLPLSGPGGMIERLAAFPRPRKLLVHINNTNPILDEDSPERRVLDGAGIGVAHDGQRIDLT
jgi:pyrroloquinoline quinone biosynthesis protein B